jgi:hypothetical protein
MGVLQVRRVITNPTVKHNLSQLLAKAEGDKQQVRSRWGNENALLP